MDIEKEAVEMAESVIVNVLPASLATLLVEKGVFTEEEFGQMVAKHAEETVKATLELGAEDMASDPEFEELMQKMTAATVRIVKSKMGLAG